MLQAYRSTPHPATKETPYKLLMNREVRTKLDHFPTATSPHDERVRENDSHYKTQRKMYHDKRHKTTTHQLRQGDAVVVKHENKRKGQTPYEPYVYIITEVKGSQIIAKREKDDRTIRSDASKFKPLRITEYQDEMISPSDDETESLPNGLNQGALPNDPNQETSTTTNTTFESYQHTQPEEPESLQPQPRRSERLKNKHEKQEQSAD